MPRAGAGCPAEHGIEYIYAHEYIVAVYKWIWSVGGGESLVDPKTTVKEMVIVMVIVGLMMMVLMIVANLK